MASHIFHCCLCCQRQENCLLVRRGRPRLSSNSFNTNVRSIKTKRAHNRIKLVGAYRGEKINNLVSQIIANVMCRSSLDSPMFYLFFFVITQSSLNETSWQGCRIHWLHLCRGVRQPLNECLITLNHLGALGDVESLFIAIAPSRPWPGVVAPDRVLSLGQIVLFYI